MKTEAEIRELLDENLESLQHWKDTLQEDFFLRRSTEQSLWTIEWLRGYTEAIKDVLEEK